jgi:lipid-A-disaccharide synthase
MFGLLKVEHVSLPNVLAGEALVPELLQEACTPVNIAAALLPMLRDPGVAAALLPRFRDIHGQLRQDASARAADAVSDLLA